ncbi:MULTISPECIES: hypothetical protein [Streptomyces]|uniref:Uncharacterized protein n=2 Tax=Streptomyces TaxID=1883 RepID=A0A117IVV8_9ACTN|nr:MULTISPECIES: hypothetical protein [Streptomyces]KUH37985.1 hypothetical protein ATE80_15225 [Streptomyces kanasensis]UUS32589.1 hypothetical protein NRO40_18415 [Streptomyces changanensis]
MNRPTVFSVVLGITATAAVALPGSAATADGRAVPPPADRYCVMVVDKAPDGGMSPVRSTTCSADPASKSLTRAAANTVLLMEWFEHANNKPSSLTRVHGEAGDCDGDGYRLRATGFWANRISGFNAYSKCNVATGYDLVNLSGDRETWRMDKPCKCLLQGWVGAYMNDRVESFWIRQG